MKKEIIEKQLAYVTETLSHVNNIDDFISLSKIPWFGIEINGEHPKHFKKGIDDIFLMRVEYKNILVYMSQKAYDYNRDFQVSDYIVVYNDEGWEIYDGKIE